MTRYTRPLVRGGSLCGWLLAAAAVVVLAGGCAGSSRDAAEAEREAQSRSATRDRFTGLRLAGRPSETADAIWRGQFDGKYRVQDYEHHLERLSPDGMITLVAEPGPAQVFLVERSGLEIYQGETPLRFYARGNGMSHIFVLRRPGYVDRRIDVGVSHRHPDVRVRVVLEEDLQLADPYVPTQTPYDNLREQWNIRRPQRLYTNESMPEPRGYYARSLWPAAETAPEGTTNR